MAVVHITGDVHYLLLSLVGRRVVLSVHDLAAVHSNTGFKKFIITWFQYRIPLRLATITTAISTVVKQELLDHLGVNPEKYESSRIVSKHNLNLSPRLGQHDPLF